MKSISLIVSVLFFIFSPSAQACLNGETKILKNGAFIYEDYEGMIPHGHQFVGISQLDEVNHELDSLYKKTRDIDYLSDKGYVLILQGKYQEAINLYLEIEKIKPNRYSTASNIGTAYELIGNNQKALEWIKKSVQIDKESHNGSEWLHVKILEAKIKGNAYITSLFLINTDFGSGESPTTKLSPKELLELQKALYYQLNERISFIKKEDKIIALLMFDLGNVFFLINNDVESTETLYQKAKGYGFSNSFLEKRLAFIQSKIKKHDESTDKDIPTIEKKEPVKQKITKSSESNNLYIYLLGGVILAGILFFLLRNKFNKKD